MGLWGKGKKLFSKDFFPFPQLFILHLPAGPHFFNQGCCGEAGNQGERKHGSAVRFHYVAADDAIRGPVSAFDQDVGTDGADKFQGSIFVKFRYVVHGSEVGQDKGAGGKRVERALRPFVLAFDGQIAVQAEDQHVAQRFGPGQQIHMAGVNEIKAAVGENKAFSFGPQRLKPRKKRGGGQDGRVAEVGVLHAGRLSGRLA